MVVIALVVVMIYSNIYDAPFVFDDVQQIEENAKIRDLGRCLSHRPIAELTFALNYRFGGLNVFGYHVVNVLIHIVNGFLVYLLGMIIFKRLLICPPQSEDFVDGLPDCEIRKTSPRSREPGSHFFQPQINIQQSTISLMSLFAALFFVSHPLQTQAVTYIIQRHASLAATFYFLSVYL